MLLEKLLGESLSGKLWETVHDPAQLHCDQPGKDGVRGAGTAGTCVAAADSSFLPRLERPPHDVVILDWVYAVDATSR
jgi:hypothetical protein